MAVQGQVIYTNTLTYANGGTDVLSPLITSLFDQDLASFEIQNDTIGQLGFKTSMVTTPLGVFTIGIGAFELPVITEGQDLPIATTGKGANKGYAIVEYGAQIPVTKLFRKWLESAKDLNGADSSVKAEWQTLAQNIMNLRYGRVKTMNQVATQLFTLGWSSSAANGPGSPTPYGQSLFALNHIYGGFGGLPAGTFQNILGGSYGTADTALSAVTLQQMLNIHKNELKLQNGDRIDSPDKYTLMVSRSGAVNARAILNTPGNQVTMYSGTGSNANQMNTFSFMGNIVEIQEMPYLGSTKQDGTLIGTNNYYFLINKPYASMAGAMRLIKLWDAEVRVYQNDSNGNTFVAMDMGFAIDHYGLESYITGSRGTV